MADTISFIDSAGVETSLRSNNYLCNPRECKEFKYINNGDNLYETSKQFSLTILCLSPALANSLVDKMEKDTQLNKFSKIKINGWYCCVKFMGVSVLQNDEEGLVKISVSFYAPSFVWYKDQIKTITSVLSFDFALSHSAAFSITATPVLDNNNKYKYKSIIVEEQGGETGNDVMTLEVSNLSMAIDPTLNTDYFEKSVYRTMFGQQYSEFDKVNITSDFFFIIPPGSYRWLLVDGVTHTVTLHEMRGCPEWSTT